MKKPMFTRVCAFLAIGAGVVFAANADAKWTYENNVLTGIAADGETAMQLNLTADGVLSAKKNAAGTQKEIDLSSDAMPSGTPKIRVISASTFYGNGNITSVKLPETLEVIGGSAFYNCSGLVEVKPFVPNTVTNIGWGAFGGGSGVAIAITNGFEVGFGEQEVTFGVDANNQNQALARCSSLAFIKYGPKVKKVPQVFYCAAYGGVKELEIGENVEEFADCMGLATNLTRVVFKGTKDVTIPPQTFSNYSTFPSTVKEIVFNGWVNWTVSTGNPFGGWKDNTCRFVVPGNNFKWASFMADSTKMTPWASCSTTEQNTYSTLFTDGTTPVGMTVKQTGMSRVYVVTDGTTLEGNYLVFENHKDEFGTLTCVPALGENGLCTETSVKVTFAPADGVTFTGWMGDVGNADTTSTTITLTPNGITKVKPVFTSTFLVYDKDAGELTNGDWVETASGEREAITVGAIQRLNFNTTTYALDLSLPIKDGGTIVGINGKLGANNSITSFTLPNTIQTLGDEEFRGLKVPLTPMLPDSVTSLGHGCFTEARSTGNFRVGFATDGNGNSVETKFQGNLFNSGGGNMGPLVELGPGIRSISSANGRKELFNGYGSGYKGAMEVKIGPNVASAAETVFKNFGGTNSVTFTIESDMFTGSSSMFSGSSGTSALNYRCWFYVGAEGCKKWQEFIANTEYVTSWKSLDSTVQAEYKKYFAKGTPYGLTTAAAALSDGSGLPEAVWVFSLKPMGMCIRIQ